MAYISIFLDLDIWEVLQPGTSILIKEINIQFAQDQAGWIGSKTHILVKLSESHSDPPEACITTLNLYPIAESGFQSKTATKTLML